MTVLELSFPVIAIRGAGMVSYDSPLKLASWDLELVQNREYKKLRLIDSGLREYSVADVHITGAASRLARWIPLIPARVVNVDLDLEAGAQLSLDEAKEQVLAVLNAAADYWGAYDVDEMKARITAATSPAELVNAVPG